jgi:epoxyqueuosine reductase
LKEQIPTEFKGKMNNWMFGCDVCQDVCPWNRFAVPHQEKEFIPHFDLLGLKKDDWQEITHEIFQTVFKNSAVKRAKLEGLKRNIEFLKPSY